MKQTRFASLLESWGNTIVGFVGSLALQWAICSYYALPLRVQDNLAIILAFTAWSLVRGYCWRRLMEALQVRTPLSPALLAINAERRRQVEVEGWSAAHDDGHAIGELERAAAAYAVAASVADVNLRRQIKDRPLAKALWPWSLDWFKPLAHDRRRDLVRAGALLVAALEKHDRARRKHTRILDRGYASGGFFEAKR